MRKSVTNAKTLVHKCCLHGDPKISAVLSIFNEMLQQHDGLLLSCNKAEFHGAFQQGHKLILNLYRDSPRAGVFMRPVVRTTRFNSPVSKGWRFVELRRDPFDTSTD